MRPETFTDILLNIRKSAEYIWKRQNPNV